MKKILISFLVSVMVCGVGFCEEKVTSADDYSAQIIHLINEEKYTEALEVSHKAVADYPTNAELFSLRGYAYENLNSRKSAIINYDKAISLDPKCEDAYFYRGITKIGMEDFKGAYVDFTTCTRVNPNSGHCYTGRGAARMAMFDLEGGKRDMDKGMAMIDQELEQIKVDIDKLMEEAEQIQNSQ